MMKESMLSAELMLKVKATFYSVTTTNWTAKFSAVDNQPRRGSKWQMNARMV